MSTATETKTSEKAEKKKKSFLYNIESPDLQFLARRFLDAFAAVLKHSNYKSAIDVFSRVSMKCAICTSTCPVYQVTNDPKDIPCYRTRLLAKIYKRYFTFGGYLHARYISEYNVRDSDIMELMDLLYRCTACRRCVLECPMGIDHGLMTHMGRYILSEMNLTPRALQVSVEAQLEGPTHNTSAIPVEALKDTLEFLEEELEEITGQKIKFPLDKKNVEYVFFPAVSDFMMEAETLMGNAAVMHATGNADNWTIGTQNYDGINYGLFYNDGIFEKVIHQLVDEVRRLGGKKIMIGECGHASRSAKIGVPMWGGTNPPPVINCMEYLYDELKKGSIKLNPNVITKSATYHDPCNLARMGWVVEQPRYIIKQFIKDFREMTPTGRENYCCGGGGGTVSIDEMFDFRMKIGGWVKAEQIRATGADYVIAPCANCKKQVGELLRYYELDTELIGLHDLVLKAIVWD